MLRKPYTLILVILLSLLTACGFQLRGQLTLPPALQHIYIQSEIMHSSLPSQLSQMLNQLGAKTTLLPKNAQVIIDLMNETFTQQVITNGANSQIAQTLVIYYVEFQLTDTHGRVLLSPQVVSSVHSYSQNSNQILSVTNDLGTLEQDMRREVLEQILRRIIAKNTLSAVTQNETLPSS